MVKLSDSWSVLEMNFTSKSFQTTLWRTKWKSTWMCLVWAWEIGFEAMASTENYHTKSKGYDEGKHPSPLKLYKANITQQ